MFPNGDFATFDRSNLQWTLTNQKGLRRSFKDGKYTDLTAINCLKQTDPSTCVVTKMRADQVITIEYKDGSFYCQHADGTQMYTEAKGRSIRIEKQGFAPVTHKRCAIPDLNSEDLFEVDKLKSLDGVIVCVELPDGCTV